MKTPNALQKGTLGLAVAAIVGSLPDAVIAQVLEQVIVTATRRESSAQETPISILAFTGEDLELGGIDAGRDIGIMVPNVVLNPSTGGGQSQFYVRGLPGVGIYIDGIWQGGFGFQQTNFAEMERVEVLRGPQGTLFGRNTNGGAINMTTRRPGDEFGARISMDLGSYNRRNISLAVDVPISDQLKTKFMASSMKSDGFLDSVTTPRTYGDQDDTIFRADVLWEPSDTFSLRITANDERKASTDARIVRITDPTHPRYIAYNVLAGNPDFLEQADAIDPTWDDALTVPGPFAFDRFTPETHQPGFPGGQLTEWQTRSDTMADGIRQDLKYLTATVNWDITENIHLESLTSTWELNRRQVIDFDSSEFTITTDDIHDFDENFTQEFHLTGSNLDGRVSWLAGLYYLDQKNTNRFHRWGLWEFAVPNTGESGPGGAPPVPGVPALDLDALNYVRAWGNTVGNPGVANFFPIVFITADQLERNEDTDKAFFGEVTFSATDRLDVTLGIRVTSDDGREVTMTPVDGFRQADPQQEASGDLFAGFDTSVVEDVDLGNVTTNKVALTYQLANDRMLYFSWGEGFTSGSVGTNRNWPFGPIVLKPEIVTTREIGLKADFLDGRLRFNGSYFDSDWEGMRTPILPPDPNNPGQQLPFPVFTSEGVAEVSGAELELTYLAGDRWQFNAGLGLIDSEYVSIGSPPAVGFVNGLRLGAPFAYASDLSASLGVQYNLPLSNGNRLLFVGNYGWMDEYQRDPAFQRQPVDGSGNIIMEPAYGLLNARVVLEPADAEWSLSLWGTNLTDEWYVNGGFDARNVWGYDFAIIGRAREVGVGLNFAF